MKKEKSKVGAKPKYKEGVKTETLHVLIPSEKKADCLYAISQIVKPYLN
jgi:hypothetical protein